MRILALLIALAVSVQAQTLKWTYQIPEPPAGSSRFDYDKIRSDAVGNTAFSHLYALENDTHEISLVWVSSTGKQLLTDSFSTPVVFAILHVSGSELVVYCDRGSNAPFLRRYIRRGGVVTSKDTEMLGKTSVPGRDSSVDHLNKFVIVAEHNEAGFPIKLHRYNLK